MTTKAKLKSKKFREAYAAERVRSGIAYQITALREQRKLSQTELGQIMGKPQSVISRLEDPDYGRVSLKTLIEVADALDVALTVKFTEFSKIVADANHLSRNDLMVNSFDTDTGFDISPAADANSNISNSRPKSLLNHLNTFRVELPHTGSPMHFIEVSSGEMIDMPNRHPDAKPKSYYHEMQKRYSNMNAGFNADFYKSRVN